MNSDLLDYINNLEIIDTHEHLPGKEQEREKDTDIIKEYLIHYFSRDLMSAGLSKKDYQRITEQKLPILEKWKIIEPYWEISRYTGYGRALDISARDIYGVEKIDSSTIEELNDRFQKTLKPGHFKKILKDRCKIKTSLLIINTLSEKYDPQEDRSIYCDRDYFSPVYTLSGIIMPLLRKDIERIEDESEIKITSFSRYLEATEVLIDKAYKLGAVALKNGLAYFRTLKYERVSKAEAEEEFGNIFKTAHYFDGCANPVFTGKAFQDYMFHFILDIANRKNMIVQIHTGFFEGSGNYISNGNPELLVNLFLEYPNVVFDIFHISYPYQNILTVLAKNFPNVYIDMTFAHLVSPYSSVNSLLEFIDTVPLNKIAAFGGDYEFIDGVYGHLKLAQENVAKVLSIKVEEGLFDVDKAKKVARMLFYDNPKNIFRL